MTCPPPSKAGERDEAGQLFAEVETRQTREEPQDPRHYSQQGFIYCDLLLSRTEQAAWLATLSRTGFQAVPDQGLAAQGPGPRGQPGPALRLSPSR